jgi:hypothetical protein
MNRPADPKPDPAWPDFVCHRLNALVVVRAVVSSREKTGRSKINSHDKQHRKAQRFWTIILAISCVAVPISGYALIAIVCQPEPLKVNLPQAVFQPSPIRFSRTSVGPIPTQGQMITNITFADINADSHVDILAADARRGEIACYRNDGNMNWKREVLNKDQLIPAPSHITPLDLDGDGDQDFLISALGRIQPTNDEVGRLMWLENRGDGYTLHSILDNVRRVTDAQGGDFDADGDIDLVVAVFGGPLQGQILYLENDGQQNFTDYELLAVSGTIHVPVDDFDDDGDLDFAAVVTQDEEEVIGFVNDGTGFRTNRDRTRLYASWNFDLGGAGMIARDLDLDGDKDLLLSLGDNLELMHNYPQPWHGCVWLENQGDWQFIPHRIANIGGIYATETADIDLDGDLDIIVVSMFNDWSQKNAASVLWLENDGKQNFTTYQIADQPVQLATVGCADLNHDGQMDIVTGSFHFRRPFNRFGSVDVFSVISTNAERAK